MPIIPTGIIRRSGNWSRQSISRGIIKTRPLGGPRNFRVRRREGRRSSFGTWVYPKDGTGTYSKTTASLTTGPQVRSIAVANYHKAMMARASESIERFPADKRDISSLTISASEGTVSAIVAKITEIRREFLEMSDADKNSRKVIQVNFQVFPVSQTIDFRDSDL